MHAFWDLVIYFPIEENSNPRVSKEVDLIHHLQLLFPDFTDFILIISFLFSPPNEERALILLVKSECHSSLEREEQKLVIKKIFKIKSCKCERKYCCYL